MRAFEVARLAGCADQTVRRWADAGHLPCVYTASGQRRYPRREIEALFRGPDAPRPWRAGMWEENPHGPITRQPPRYPRWEQTDALDALDVEGAP